MNHYQWLGLVALSAAVVKTLVLFRAKSTTAVSSAFCFLSLALILESSLEFSVSMVATAGASKLNAYMHGVIITIYLSLLALLNFCLVVSQSIYRRTILTLFFFWAAVLIVLQLSGRLIAGFKLTGYSVVSVPGDYYLIFPMFALASVLVACSVLVSALQLKSSASERSKVALKALSLILLVVAFVAFLKVLGYDASTGAILPIATTFFLWILLLDERQEFVIFETKLQRRWALVLIKWLTLIKLALKMKDIDANKWHEEVDDNLLRGALGSAESKQDAAELLGMARTTLHSKLKKNGIN